MLLFVGVSLVRWRRLAGQPLRYLGLLLTGGLVFNKYLVGEVMLVSVMLASIYVSLFIFALHFGEGTVEAVLKKSTVMPLHAKKYSFYWLLYLFLAETVALIIYSCSEVFLDIEWIQNIVHCLVRQGRATDLPYD